MRYYGVWIDGKGDHYGTPVLDDLPAVKESLLTTTDGYPDKEDTLIIWDETGRAREFFDHEIQDFIPYM